MPRFDLSGEEWAVIAPRLPPSGREPKRKDGPLVLNGIFYALRKGAPWRDLPERYHPHTTAYNRCSLGCAWHLGGPIQSLSAQMQRCADLH